VQEKNPCENYFATPTIDIPFWFFLPPSPEVRRDWPLNQNAQHNLLPISGGINRAGLLPDGGIP